MLGARQRELALLGITPTFQASAAVLKEDSLPGLQLAREIWVSRDTAGSGPPRSR